MKHRLRFGHHKCLTVFFNRIFDANRHFKGDARAFFEHLQNTKGPGLRQCQQHADQPGAPGHRRQPVRECRASSERPDRVGVLLSSPRCRTLGERADRVLRRGMAAGGTGAVYRRRRTQTDETGCFHDGPPGLARSGHGLTGRDGGAKILPRTQPGSDVSVATLSHGSLRGHHAAARARGGARLPLVRMR